jgi:alpha-galactosidase
MPKICFLGAGSTIFAKNVLGDCLATDRLKKSHITLVDIDPDRLRVSEVMLKNMNETMGAGATIESFMAGDAGEAIYGADFIVNAIQVGGYEPSTVIDFEVPKKYGLRQTIGDTIGVGGIFRGLRTIPIMIDYCRIIEENAPNAWLLNYSNPMAILTGAILKATNVKTVGLCHSVQVCATNLCWELGLPTENLDCTIAGINHQAWLLEISRDGEDLYPEIKQRAQMEENSRKDPVRFEIMRRFGYYVTESSEHSSEYVPWFIKSSRPELIQRFQIPLDEYPRRCVDQIKGWNGLREFLLSGEPLNHERTAEYASYIIDAVSGGEPYCFGGNVLNRDFISNLPVDSCVEVPCIANVSGISPQGVGHLPPQCAAVNRTNINVQELTIEAALTRKKEHVYQAALLDPHTAAELTIDETVALCDDLFAAHKDHLPEYF